MATCYIHNKNRKIQFLQRNPETGLWRCLPGFECQTGRNDTFFLGGLNATPLAHLNPSFGQPFVHPEPNNGNFQICHTHGKSRNVQYLDRVDLEDGSCVYKCKESEECKLLGDTPSHDRRNNANSNTINSNRALYAPPSPQRFNNFGVLNQQGRVPQPNQRGMQLGGGGGLGGLGQRSYQDQQHNGYSQWASHHQDYYNPAYNHNYNPGYTQPSYHAYQHQQPARSNVRQRCHLHGKMRTQANMHDLGNDKWECSEHDRCKVSPNEQQFLNSANSNNTNNTNDHGSGANLGGMDPC